MKTATALLMCDISYRSDKPDHISTVTEIFLLSGDFDWTIQLKTSDVYKFSIQICWYIFCLYPMQQVLFLAVHNWWIKSSVYEKD